MEKIFIGYDQKEAIAFHTCMNSILKNTSSPFQFVPLRKENLPEFKRESSEQGSTDFSFSRFLVPHLCNFEGQALYVDCDFIFTSDISKLFDYSEDDWAIKVCKHQYTPKYETKFLNNPQTKYPKKNWSSLMIFNNSKCRSLSPEYVNKSGGEDLHQFKWVDESYVREIPLEYNFLVDEYGVKKDIPSGIHFTNGGPWFDDYKEVDYKELWQKNLNEVLAPLKQ